MVQIIGAATRNARKNVALQQNKVLPLKWRVFHITFMQCPIAWGPFPNLAGMNASATKPTPEARDAYRVFRPITSRWMDNDVYGHVNNVVYYSWFDTAVNAHLIEQGVLDIHHGQTIGLVIETQCNYFASLAFPQTIEAGIRVAKLGKSSVRYEVGLFAQGEHLCAAKGHFVHVYVDRESRRPVELPLALRTVLEKLL